MMNRKQAKTAFIVFSIVLLLGVIGLAALLTFRKEDTSLTNFLPIFGELKSPVEQNFDNNIKLDYSDSEISNIPSTNKVYIVDDLNPYFPSQTLASRAADSFGLKLDSNEDGVALYTHIDKQEYVKFDANSDSITLHLNEMFASSSKYLLTEEKGTIVAKSKLEELGLWPYSDNYNVEFEYFRISGMSYYETNDKKTASLLQVSFSSTLDGLPVKPTSTSSGEIDVIINLDDNVAKIYYSYRPVDESEVATYPIITPKEAISRITRKEAELILPFEGDTPSIVSLDKFEMIYRVQFDGQTYLQPVYLFEGIDNNKQTVTLLVPAITDEYLRETN